MARATATLLEPQFAPVELQVTFTSQEEFEDFIQLLDHRHSVANLLEESLKDNCYPLHSKTGLIALLSEVAASVKQFRT